MNITKTTTLVALVLAAGLGLAGCASEGSQITPTVVTGGSGTVGASQTAGPGGEVIVDPVEPEGYVVGEVLTVVPDDLLPSQRAFPMADGTFIVVDRYEPLPAPVQEAITAQAAEVIGWNAGYDGMDQADTQAAERAATQLKTDLIRTTAKNVVVVYKGDASDAWISTSGDGPWYSRDEAAAGAQALIDVREDAASWVVAVSDGI